MTSRSSFHLSFKFKGERSYVQGPDIFNAVSKCASIASFGYISRMRLDKLLATNALLLIGDAIAYYSKDSFCGTGTLVCPCKGTRQFALLPLIGSIIEEKYDYDEEEIFDLASIAESDRSCSIVSATRYSLIEEAVALTKLLNNNLFPPEDSKKWLFVGIVTNAELSHFRGDSELQIFCKKLIANRFSKNDILLGSAHLGTINFAVASL